MKHYSIETFEPDSEKLFTMVKGILIKKLKGLRIRGKVNEAVPHVYPEIFVLRLLHRKSFMAVELRIRWMEHVGDLTADDVETYGLGFSHCAKEENTFDAWRGVSIAAHRAVNEALEEYPLLKS